MNRPSIFRRFCFVMLITGVVTVVLWALQNRLALDVQLVYSYAIATPIWLLTDLVRRRLFPMSEGQPWSQVRGEKIFILTSIVLGFIIGTAIGDWYGGWSTFDLWRYAPQKLAGYVILCVSISMAFIVFYYQQNRLHIAQRQATESKLQLLQSQLEPHMLFNTLANLRVLIDLDSARATAMLDRLIDYLRATLGASRVTTHALALEFARLDDYLALMHIRMGSRLRYTLDLPAALQGTPCPALLLQPLVENAVIHGLEPSAAGGAIHVGAVQKNQHLILTVMDTGKGYDSAEPGSSKGADSSSGFGLAQMRERLVTLYGSSASVTIQDHLPSGTLVTITMPLTTKTHETN
ncbi:MAG: histidine kinase [Cytophagales bacterium]|nr:histidine kinase [Cytophagales bacterium]